MPKPAKEVKCPICGKMDNDWKERSGLCLECYCKELSKHVFDKIDNRHPSLEEASNMIRKEFHENRGLSTL